MKLYEITTELIPIQNQLSESDGELTLDLEKTFDSLNMALEEKVSNIGRMFLNLEVDAEEIAGQEAALKERLAKVTAKRKAKENLQKRLADYVKANMEAVKREKFDFRIFKVWIQNNGGDARVEITNNEAVPGKFIDIVPAKMEVNLDRIRDAAEAGENVSAFAQLKRGTHLRIK